MIRVLIADGSADGHAVDGSAPAKLLEQERDIRLVAMARNGREAMELMTVNESDIVVLDWFMPLLNGLEVARRALRKRPGFPVIILTLDHSPHRCYQARRVGVRGFLMKSDEIQHLAKAIREVAAGGTFFSPSLFSGSSPLSHPTRDENSCPLSDRECDVLQLVAEGKLNKEIAHVLQLSVRTVEDYRARLMKKLNIRGLRDLVLYAIREGFIRG